MSLTRRQLLKSAMAGAASLSSLRAQASPSFGNLRLAIAIQAQSVDGLKAEADWANKAGFERVQINLWMPDADEASLRSMASELEGRGLSTVSFGCYVNPLDPGNSGYMGFSVKTMEALARCAGLFGASTFVTWSGGYQPRFGGGDDRNSTPEAMDRLVDGTKGLLARVELCHGRISFEPYYPDILGTPERYSEFFRRMPAHRVGITMDPPNFVKPEQFGQRSQILSQAFDMLSDRILLAHLKDIGQAADGSITLPGPLDGKMNYDLYLTRLASLGRPIDCVIEHTGGADMARHHDQVKRAIERVSGAKS